MDLVVRLGEREARVRVERDGDEARVVVDETEYRVDEARLGDGRSSLIVDGQQHEVTVESDGNGGYVVSSRRGRQTVEVFDPLTWMAEQAGSGRGGRRSSKVTAYMPGRVVTILVEEGQEIRAGQGLVVLEAMKMENEIQADADGVIERIAVSEGQAVDGGDLLFEIG